MKFEAMFRKVEPYYFFTGIITTSSFSVGDLAKMDVHYTANSDGNIEVRILKELKPVTDKYNSDLSLLSLEDFISEEVWQGYDLADGIKSDCHFGGNLIARDNHLLPTESETDTSRVAAVGVFLGAQLKPLFEGEHAMFRSIQATETEQEFIFLLSPDKEVNETIDTIFKGDSASSFLRHRFWTNEQGEVYGLNHTYPNKSASALGQYYKELCAGEVSEKTKEIFLQECNFSNHPNPSFIEFMRNMAKECDFYLEKHARLLTNMESEEIDKLIYSVINKVTNN